MAMPGRCLDQQAFHAKQGNQLLSDDYHNSRPHALPVRAGHQCILSVGGSAMPTLTTISRPSRTDRCGLMMSSVPMRKMSPTYLQVLPTLTFGSLRNTS